MTERFSSDDEYQRMLRQIEQRTRDEAELETQRTELSHAAARTARYLVENEVEVDVKLGRKSADDDPDAHGWLVATRQEPAGERPGRHSVAQPDEEVKPEPIFQTTRVILTAAGELKERSKETTGEEDATTIEPGEDDTSKFHFEKARLRADKSGLRWLAAQNKMGDPFPAEPIEKLDEYMDETREIVAEKGLNLGDNESNGDNSGHIARMKARAASAKEWYSKRGNLSKALIKVSAALGAAAATGVLATTLMSSDKEETGPPPRPSISATPTPSKEGEVINLTEAEKALGDMFTDVAKDNAAEGVEGQITYMRYRDPKTKKVEDLPSNYVVNPLIAPGLEQGKYDTALVVESCPTGENFDLEVSKENPNCSLKPVAIDPKELMNTGLVVGDTYEQ